MITDYDVAFRKAQSIFNGRGFRLPKDWEEFKSTRMTEHNVNKLREAAMYFNTTFSNVDIDKYMICGFELWKGFTYNKLLDKRVIDSYIHKEKASKRRLEITHREIEISFNNISDYLSDKPKRPGYGQLQNYCKIREGEVRIIINMYVQGKIDVMTLAYCVNRRYINLTDDERALSPYLVQRYRDVMEQLQTVSAFIAEKERELNEECGR